MTFGDVVRKNTTLSVISVTFKFKRSISVLPWKVESKILPWKVESVVLALALFHS